MSEKYIDLSDFGILRTVDVRDIYSITHVLLQNNEFSRVIVLLKDKIELKGPILYGCNAVREETELLKRYQQIIGGE